jgi:DNA topoisomerase-1
LLSAGMQTILSLPHKEIVRLDRNYREVARTVRLLYVSDAAPGISRLKKGTGFRYVGADGKRLSEADLARVKKLVIPPAWTRVWICSSANGHIQATGYDLRGRKQYRYHALWNAARKETKFHRLFEFGKSLPQLRLRLEEDLGRKELCQEKVVAAVIALMERTYIRIGNEDYEKLYGSHGITTLKDQHVTITGNTMRFSFKGKKGVVQNVSLNNRRLARVVKQCRDIPGKELFQYYDAAGTRHAIDSGEVNDYIKEATQTDYTAKDFRTWAGSLNLLRALKAAGQAITDAERKKNILAALDDVSRKLGNTRTVCRNYYVHPTLIELYEKDELNKYLRELDAIELPDGQTELTGDEKLLMRILKSLH